MKLIKQKAELLIQPKGLNGLEKQIEIAARTCYKSENNSTGDSKSFVDKLIKMKHFSMLEHGTVYLYTALPNGIKNPLYKYAINPYSKVITQYDCVDDEIYTYVSSNYRVLIENNWEDDLKYICEPTAFHRKRYTFRLTTSISIVRELLRHRVFSFANESTRYCNYSKDKFDNELTFILPSLYDGTCKEFRELASLAAMGCQIKKESEHYANLAAGLMFAESVYITLTDKYKVSPQFAREVLPLCTKSELIMTGFEDDWNNFLDVRLRGTTGKPHPDMIELAQMIQDELNKI